MRGRSILRVTFLLLLSIGLLAPPAAAQQQLGKVLVFSKTAGFRHDSIPAGIAMIQQLGAEHDFEVDTTEDSAQFTEENLAQYDAVIWLSTTGDVLNGEQQAAFEEYIRSGGGYVGIHAAADTEYDWAWYGGLVGAYFESHPPGTPTATVDVEDKVHPSTAHLPNEWTRVDEWYDYQTNPRGQVHVLASVDDATMSSGSPVMGTRHLGDHPIAWCQDNYDGGRSWYTGMGHTQASFSEPNFVQHVLGGIQTAAGWVRGDCGATVWDNYEVVQLATGGPQFGEPIDMEVLPDGRVLYTTRNGQFHLVNPETGANTVIATLPVYTHDEDGLQGIELSPTFDEDGWLYVFYAPPLNTPPGDAPANGTPEQFEAFKGANYVSRFQLDLETATIDLDSEEVLLEIPTDRGRCCHVGGDLVFGENGDLFISTGDDTDPFSSNGHAPIDDREGRSPAFDARRSSANTNDLRGKILRIRPLAEAGDEPGPGSTYEIPEGNLFPPGTEGTRPEIFVMGLRNPFRIEYDPVTNAVLWGEYGPDAGSAGAQGPMGYVEWSMTTVPENHGWPLCIADNKPYPDWNFDTNTAGPLFDCDAPVNDSRHNTGLTNLPPAQPADLWYGDTPTQQPWREFGSGGQSPMGGPIYRYDPALNSPTKFPEYFDGKAFLYEWSRDWVLNLHLNDAEGDVYDLTSFLPNSAVDVSPPLWDNPMDMEFGPEGSLYVLNYGDGYFGENPDAGLYRIDYTQGSSLPVARASATPTSGQAPLTVSFSAEGSSDPGGGELTYEWDFDGDGEVDATGVTVTHTYTTNGQYPASVRVTNELGLSAAAAVTITVGNTAPVVELTLPPNGGFFSFGDEVAFEVSVTDPEDDVDCDDVIVNYALGHANHAHGLTQTTGCEGTISTPRDAGHPATEELYGVITATYTDKGGDGVPALSDSDGVELNPKHLQAEHFDDMSGIQVQPAEGAEGGARVGFTDPGDWIAFTPANLTGITAVQLRGSSGGSGGPVEFRWNAPDGPLLGTIEVESTGDWENHATFGPVDLTGAPAETGTLYLVFPDGGLDVDSLTFLGIGVAEQGAPQVTATATPTSGVAPLEVTFGGTVFDPEGGDLTYAWDFGDGGTADTLEATHTYTEPGTYTAVLSVTDDQGLTGRGEVTIEVTSESLPPIDCLGNRSDEFDGDSLDTTRWSNIVRPDLDAVTVADGALTIEMGSGDMYEGNQTAENLILQPAPQGAWTVTTELSMTGTDQWQQAGIMVYADDQNFAKAGIVGVGGGNQKLEFLWQNNGVMRNTPEDGLEPLPADFPDTFQLRVSSDGTNLTASYSVDGGATFTPFGRTVPMGGTHGLHVGLYAFKALEESPAQSARFEFFRVTPDDTAGDRSVSDEFDGTALDGCRWDRVVRYDPTALEMSDGELTITVPDGDIYTADTDPPPNNFILQTAPDGDWTIETHISRQTLIQWYQQGGLMVYVDDDNYVKFDIIADQGSTSGVNRIELRSEVDGVIQNPQPQVTGAALPANPDGSWYLRLTKTGNSYAGAFSPDGETWTSMSEPVPNPALADDAAFGIFTLGASQQEEATVTFDYFRLLGEEPPGEELPACPALSDTFDGDALNLDLWSATVRHDPDGYTVADGNLTMPTTATDIYGANNGGTPNIILQPLPDGPWQATVHLTAQVYDAYQQAGLIVYGDDDNYVKMVFEGRNDNASDPAARVFQLLQETNASPTEWNTTALGAGYPDTVWVRLSFDGTTLTGSYSADGESFTDMGQSLSLAGITDPRIGLVALAGSGQPVTDAVFHEFVLATEDCPVVDTTPPTVTAQVAGDGSEQVTVTLSADDGDGSGVDSIEWREAGASEWQTYTGPLTFDEPGDYTIEYRATDNAGNTSEPGSVEFSVVAPPPPCPALSDSFDGDELNRELWSAIVRENPDLYSVEGGDLVMTATATDIYGTNNTDTPNLILQPLPDGPWQATAQLTMQAYQAYQQAGLLVYGDDDNYAKMVLQGRDTSTSNPATRIFQFIREENGQPNEVGASNTGPLGAGFPDTVWVRFASDGQNLTAWYSADGETFTPMPETKSLAGMTNPRIGLVALAGSGRPVTEVAFHEFVLATADCPEPEPEDTTPPTVTAQVAGDGSEQVTVTLSADDGDGSGVDSIEWREASASEWQTYTGPLTFDEPGDHTIEYRATDNAGNVSDVGTVEFTVAEPPPCPEPDERDTVWINGVDTGVPNRTAPNGCTVNDLLDADGPWSSRAELVKHVNDVARELYAQGLIDGRERGELTRAAARSEIDRPRGR